jgi:anti-sigma B factor antagonist
VDLSLSERTVANYLVVEVRGEVDVHSAPQLRDRLTKLIDSGETAIVVDLGWLAFIDSTGLGALVAVRNEALAKSATLRLACKSERVLKIFRITGLDNVFEIFPTVEQAIADDQPGDGEH